MATTADLMRDIDIGLWEITAEADFLPELAIGWDQESAVERDVWYLEWRELLARLSALEAAYRAQAMTEEQQARYCELRAKLRTHLPLFERLGLPRPAIPLDP